MRFSIMAIWALKISILPLNCAENFNFAPKFPHNGGFPTPAPNFVLLEETFQKLYDRPRFGCPHQSTTTLLFWPRDQEAYMVGVQNGIISRRKVLGLP